jgi:hypothetical protein
MYSRWHNNQGGGGWITIRRYCPSPPYTPIPPHTQLAPSLHPIYFPNTPISPSQCPRITPFWTKLFHHRMQIIMWFLNRHFLLICLGQNATRICNLVRLTELPRPMVHEEHIFSDTGKAENTIYEHHGKPGGRLSEVEIHLSAIWEMQWCPWGCHR